MRGNYLIGAVVLLFFSGFIVEAQNTKPVIRLYVFFSPDCIQCEVVKQTNLGRIAEKLGCIIEPKYFNIEDIANYSKLCELEEKYGKTENELPVVFVGKYVLGKKEIEKNLEGIIKEYIRAGGTDWPEKVQIEKPPRGKKSSKASLLHDNEKRSPVYVAFFYQNTCKVCHRIFYLLNYEKEKHPEVRMKLFDLDEGKSKILFEAIANRINLPEKRRLTPGTLIIGRNYLQGKEITAENIERLLSISDTGCVWDINEDELLLAERNIKNRFRAIGLPAVIVAGLIDGLNPCAFAVLVFFISYLAMVKKTRSQVLLTGFSFMAGVFLTYFSIGCGGYALLSKFSSYGIISSVFNILVGTGALVLGVFSVIDVIRAKRGDLRDITLQLPKVLKTAIHSTIIRKIGTAKYMFGTFIAGVLISFFEFACTGQVYLPTIVFVQGSPEYRMEGIFYLFLYNLMFIIPLMVILFSTYLGISSQRFARISMKNLVISKVLLSLFFFTIGVFLILREFRNF
ncbi:MAG: hypothetical protein NC906_09730 [Candidatus Omnitrophica bacterium]|nr:hypothetical protein [Candidatus Omnitrophota bacterium]